MARCSMTSVASESLPEVETITITLKTAIIDGKDVNLASLLIPHFDLGEYSCYGRYIAMLCVKCRTGRRS